MSGPAPRPSPSPAALGVLLLAAAACACQSQSPISGVRPAPVVKQQRLARSLPALQKIAVMPFHPTGPGGSGVAQDPTTTVAGPSFESGTLAANFFADSLAAQGRRVIRPSDLELAFTGQGLPVPRLDARAAAELAHLEFGATAVALGRVFRYREREGSSVGSTRPASVAFEVTVHEAPSARRLWVGRFDETQQSITENLLRARNYPGGGTRWLTVGEFARWGAGELARSLLASP